MAEYVVCQDRSLRWLARQTGHSTTWLLKHAIPHIKGACQTETGYWLIPEREAIAWQLNRGTNKAGGE